MKESVWIPFFSVIHVQTAESSLCQYPISFPSAKIKKTNKQTNKKTTDLIIWLVLAIWAFTNALFFAGLKIKKVFQFVSGAPNDCIYTTYVTSILHKLNKYKLATRQHEF